MKSYQECMSDWGKIAGLIFLLVFVVLVIGFLVYMMIITRGLALLVPLLIFGPPYLCYLWNNRK